MAVVGVRLGRRELDVVETHCQDEVGVGLRDRWPGCMGSTGGAVQPLHQVFGLCKAPLAGFHPFLGGEPKSIYKLWSKNGPQLDLFLPAAAQKGGLF